MMRSKCLSELTFDREWQSPLESIQAILEAMPRVCLSDLQAAMEWASDDMSDNEAYVCRETGKIYWVSEEPGLLDDEEETPGDIDNIEKYLPVPDKRDLDLGTRLVFDFAARHLDDQYEKIRSIFRRRGAYGRFREMLEETNSLDAWYAFSEERTLVALTAWCESEGFDIEP